jgi:hypothetical protein
VQPVQLHEPYVADPHDKKARKQPA